jgi:hypothetical protein
MKKKLTAADMHDPQVIAETPWFSMRKVGIDIAPGERRDFYSIHYPAPGGGDCGYPGCKVLLIRHYRYLIDKVVWAIPSGGVDEGEDPAAPRCASCGKRPAGRRNASRRSFASTPPTAAAISCLSPGWLPVYAGWGWMQIRMR